MEKVPVSVVVITKNEEARLDDCLGSVRWADEIVVVDDFSSDSTVEVARKYTDKVFQKKMTNEGAHRNYAYSLASNEWVLSLDADERITPELEHEISRTVMSGTDCNGFSIPRKNFIGDHWLRFGGFYPSAQLRLFRKDQFKYEEVDVHPRAFMKDPRGEMRNPLLHYSYRDIEDFVAKLENQTNRESKKWLESEKGMSFGRALRRTIDRYWRAYHKKQGKNDGMIGYILAVMGGFYQILSYAKYWESRLDPVDISKLSDPASPEKLPPEGREQLSVVIIAKNEEKVIENCLKSLRWVDEVVVVDGMSTDRTPEICERYGAKVVRHAFGGDFGEERNLGNETCSGDWILQLDADEVVTQGFKDKVAVILKEGSKYAAYKFLRKNFFMGHFMRHGGWYHYSHHFFRKDKARYSGRVHHQLVVDGEIGALDADIEHYPFTRFSQLVNRQNRYTTLEAGELLELRGKIDEKEVSYNIRTKPYKLFWKFYVKKFGFLEGMRGFLFSVLFAWVHFLKWAKYWEMVNKDRGNIAE